jgi:hypothetical protein
VELKSLNRNTRMSELYGLAVALVIHATSR